MTSRGAGKNGNSGGGGKNGKPLLPHHRDMLERDSAIDPAVIAERGIFSATTKAEVGALGFGRTLQRVPALVFPIHGVVAGEPPWYLIRPDETPVIKGRPRKYLIPTGRIMSLDVHPRARPHLAAGKWPLFVTEGSKKCDSLLSAGARAVIGLVGVWNWRGSNHQGGKALLPDWEWVHLDDRPVFIVYDSDVALKEEVRLAMDRLGAALNRRGAKVSFVYLPAGPGGTKTGVDDFIARDGGTLQDIVALAGPLRRPTERVGAVAKKSTEPAVPVSIESAVATFQRWLHLTNPRPLYVAWGTVAANRLPGDPVWTKIVGASGAGKTEIVRSFNALPETVEVSTITETGLLSGTSSRERADDATGGLLRQIGAMGTIVVRDFTSVLSMDRDALSRVLAALREIYDGRWQRMIGADGGRVLEWEGKIGMLGGVTGAIDRHHAVMGQMGERLLLFRLRVRELELVAEQALQTVGHEQQMREELAAATSGVFAAMSPNYTPRQLTADEQKQLIAVGLLVARGRAAVFRYGARIEATVDPEVPTRLTRQLLTLARGMDSLGVPWSEAWPTTLAVALGCIPDLRARALLALYRAGGASTSDVARRVRRPTNTVRYALEDLNAHGLVTMQSQGRGKPSLWQVDGAAAAALGDLPGDVLGPSTSTSPVDRRPGISCTAPAEPTVQEIPDPTQSDDVDDDPAIPCEDPSNCRFRNRHASGPWACEFNHPTPTDEVNR